jgi:hypothetical protein
MVYRTDRAPVHVYEVIQLRKAVEFSYTLHLRFHLWQVAANSKERLSQGRYDNVMKRLALVAVVLCLATTPALAVKLTSATFGIAGVARVSCGVTYRGTEETVAGIKVFNLATELLNEEMTLSAESPASWWRTIKCPDTGCSAPWCEVTTKLPKNQFRATMCVESRTGTGDTAVYTPLVCVPVE